MKQDIHHIAHIIKAELVNVPRYIVQFFLFIILLMLFVIEKSGKSVQKIPFFGKKLYSLCEKPFSPAGKLIHRSILFFDSLRPFPVSRYYLITLAFSNLAARPNRTLITILGMSVGVGVIVYLLSLGYGIEKLVIGRVARLNELRMVDVLPGETNGNKLNQKVYIRVKKLPKVEAALPLVSVVGKMTYNNAQVDIVSYATTDEYLKYLQPNVLTGKIFSTNNAVLGYRPGSVQGATKVIDTAKMGAVYRRDVSFNIMPGDGVLARSECSVGSPSLGYVRHQEGMYNGDEVWGSEYAPFEPYGRLGYDTNEGVYLGKWYRAKMPLYYRDIQGTSSAMFEENGRQKWDTVCIRASDVIQVSEMKYGKVLGEATSSASFASPSAAIASSSASYDVVSVSSQSGSVELVSLQGAGGSTQKKNNDVLRFQGEPQAEAVASSALASLFNMTPSQLKGKKVKLQYVLVSNLLTETKRRALSQEREYTITGVIDDPQKPYIFVPLDDLIKLGVSNFSQVRVVMAKESDLPPARKTIETMGFKTTSTLDTVKQIEGVFNNIRVVLTLLGTIALGVAALGMFNTLTVSLLERTREIGGMKTMGMISDEVQDLFMSEAMIMGFAGGVGGLILGVIMGKVTSLVLTALSVVGGSGTVDVSYVPFFLIVFILMFSFFVGAVTGIYPAYRARKISALNALRYE